MGKGHPVFVSLCLSHYELQKFLLDSKLGGMNIRTIPFEMFTVYNINNEIQYNYQLDFPKIFDENGQEVYGSGYVSREFAVQQGMTGYARDLTAAQTNPRVTDEPFMVKGLRTEGPDRSNVVISNADAAKIRSASENLLFLKKVFSMVSIHNFFLGLFLIQSLTDLDLSIAFLLLLLLLV